MVVRSVEAVPMGASDATLDKSSLKAGELVVLRWDPTKHKLARWVRLQRGGDGALVEVQRTDAKGRPVEGEFGAPRSVHVATVCGRWDDRRWQKLPDELEVGKPKPSRARAGKPSLERDQLRDALFGDDGREARKKAAEAMDKLAHRWSTPPRSSRAAPSTRSPASKPEPSAIDEAKPGLSAPVDVAAWLGGAEPQARNDVASTRRACDLTQDDLAALLGVHPMTVSKWERGLSVPSDWQRAMLDALERAQARWANGAAVLRVSSFGGRVRKWLKEGVAVALYRTLATAFGGSLGL